MKLTKYYCIRCGTKNLLGEGYYHICMKCKKFFYFYGAEDGMFDGWDIEKPEKDRIKEWEKHQPPKGCLKVGKEQSLKKIRV